VTRNKPNSEHIDPCTLNCFIDGELHAGEEERIRQHVKYCRPCAFYVDSGRELKAAIARAGFRLAPGAPGTAKADHTRNGNLVFFESQPVLRAAVNQLQPTLREALLLCDVEELSYRDIALILDIPVSTVKSRISDARDTLCQLLIRQHGKSQ
jgi:DNA-directed RNA polymerase specialized sigma24 family protein